MELSWIRLNPHWDQISAACTAREASFRGSVIKSFQWFLLIPRVSSNFLKDIGDSCLDPEPSSTTPFPGRLDLSLGYLKARLNNLQFHTHFIGNVPHQLPKSCSIFKISLESAAPPSFPETIPQFWQIPLSFVFLTCAAPGRNHEPPFSLLKYEFPYHMVVISEPLIPSSALAQITKGWMQNFASSFFLLLNLCF